MWERFSYYGMRALLVLYMVKYLLQPGAHRDRDRLRRLPAARWNSCSARLMSSRSPRRSTASTPASSISTPILGGLLADRVLGQRRTVVLGAALMAIGHFMMAFEPLFLLALTFLILGNGCVQAQHLDPGGRALCAGRSRAATAPSRSSTSASISARSWRRWFAARWARNCGWHYGFAAAGVGMTIGLAIYLCRHADAAARRIRQARATTARAARPRRLAGDRSPCLLLVAAGDLFWATYEQQGNTIALWADDYTDRSLVCSASPSRSPGSRRSIRFMIFAFTPFVVALWRGRHGAAASPRPSPKWPIGCLLNAAAYADPVCRGGIAAGAGKASWLWLFGIFRRHHGRRSFICRRPACRW